MPKLTEEQLENRRFDRESKLQAYIVGRVNKYRAEHGKHIFMVKVSDRHRMGISDLILCVCGEFVAVELKVGNNQATALQQNFIDDVCASGGDGLVVRNWGQFKRAINRILEKHNKPLL